MEGALRVCGQLIELLQDGKLLGLQGVPARPEQVQGLAVPEEDGLLALMDDELRAHVEVLDGVLPHQGLIVPLVLDDAGQALLFDLLSHEALLHVVHAVADGAGVCTGALAGLEPHAALGAGELLHFVLLRLGVDGLVTHRTLGLFPLGLVEHHFIAAVGALPGGQLVGAHVDGVPAGAVDLLSREEARLGLRVFPAVGTFDYKFRHNSHPLSFIQSFLISGL